MEDMRAGKNQRGRLTSDFFKVLRRELARQGIQADGADAVFFQLHARRSAPARPLVPRVKCALPRLLLNNLGLAIAVPGGLISQLSHVLRFFHKAAAHVVASTTVGLRVLASAHARQPALGASGHTRPGRRPEGIKALVERAARLFCPLLQGALPPTDLREAAQTPILGAVGSARDHHVGDRGDRLPFGGAPQRGMPMPVCQPLVGNAPGAGSVQTVVAARSHELHGQHLVAILQLVVCPWRPTETILEKLEAVSHCLVPAVAIEREDGLPRRDGCALAVLHPRDEDAEWPPSAQLPMADGLLQVLRKDVKALPRFRRATRTIDYRLVETRHAVLEDLGGDATKRLQGAPVAEQAEGWYKLYVELPCSPGAHVDIDLNKCHILAMLQLEIVTHLVHFRPHVVARWATTPPEVEESSATVAEELFHGATPVVVTRQDFHVLPDPLLLPCEVRRDGLHADACHGPR
mmetsp:Transcript_67919/g.150425  ORF Transcript_67919/g.150425 Transcript_67919/m.150425 type:complete len:464 (+) Transcript_67919:647-2038(+)